MVLFQKELLNKSPVEPEISRRALISSRFSFAPCCVQWPSMRRRCRSLASILLRSALMGRLSAVHLRAGSVHRSCTDSAQRGGQNSARNGDKSRTLGQAVPQRRDDFVDGNRGIYRRQRKVFPFRGRCIERKQDRRDQAVAVEHRSFVGEARRMAAATGTPRAASVQQVPFTPEP